MYTEVAVVVIQEIAKYAAEQYAQRKQEQKFQRLESRILQAIESAKFEIIATIELVNDNRLLDGATTLIEVIAQYDRFGEEYENLKNFTSFVGINVQTELFSRLSSFQASDIRFHKFFLPWALVTCARAFAHIELTKLRKVSDFDAALEQFVKLRDSSVLALLGIREICDKRLSNSVFVRIDSAPGENGVGSFGYYLDEDFVPVAYFTNVPFDREERDSARAQAIEALARKREDIFLESGDRIAVQGVLDQACRHVSCV